MSNVCNAGRVHLRKLCIHVLHGFGRKFFSGQRVKRGVIKLIALLLPLIDLGNGGCIFFLRAIGVGKLLAQRVWRSERKRTPTGQASQCLARKLRLVFLRGVRRQLRCDVAHSSAFTGDQLALQFIHAISGFVIQTCGGNPLNQRRGRQFPLARTLINSSLIFLRKSRNFWNTGQIQWNTTHHGAGTFTCACRRKKIHCGLLRFIRLRLTHGAKHGALHISNGVVGTCDRAAPRNFDWVLLVRIASGIHIYINAANRRVMFSLRGANGLVAQLLPLIHVRVERLLALHALRIRGRQVLHPLLQILGLEWFWNFGRVECVSNRAERNTVRQ